MSDQSDKLRLIFWPLVRLELVCLAAYGGLLWLTLRVFPTFDPPEGLWRGGLLGVVAVVSVAHVLVPRLRLLRRERRYQKPRNGDWRSLLFMVAPVGLWGSLFCLHGCVLALCGPVVEVGRLRAEAPVPMARFYVMAAPFVSHWGTGGNIETSTTSKGKSLTFTLFLTCPLFNTPADTASGKVRFWLGPLYPTIFFSPSNSEQGTCSFSVRRRFFG